MSCGGCSGAVKRVLDKMDTTKIFCINKHTTKAFADVICLIHSRVEKYDIDIEKQKVTVTGNVTPEAVFQTVSKTGKKTSFWVDAAAVSTEAKPAETVVTA